MIQAPGRTGVANSAHSPNIKGSNPVTNTAREKMTEKEFCEMCVPW
jgi:hypothetical protein